MKHPNYISFFAFFVLLLASCSDSYQNEIIAPEVREVRFSIANEFISQSFEPMSRAEAGAKYYGMNIYKDGKPYAYGVFDDVAKMSVVLETDAEYDFECTSLREDHHKVAKIHDKSEGDVLKYPFCVGTEEKDEGKGYPLGKFNQFIYSDKENLYCIGYGKTTVADGEVDKDGFASETKDETFPSQYRWYGELEDCDISSNEIEIQLNFASFGVKVTAKEVPEGWVTWSSYSCDFFNPIINADNLEVTNVFSFNDLKSTKPYAIRLRIVWTRDSGKSNGTNNVDIEVQPKTMTCLALNFQE